MQLFSPRGVGKVAQSELFSYLCATQVPKGAAARAHSSVGQSSGLIIRRSWDHAPLGPRDRPEHLGDVPAFFFPKIVPDESRTCPATGRTGTTRPQPPYLLYDLPAQPMTRPNAVLSDRHTGMARVLSGIGIGTGTGFSGGSGVSAAAGGRFTARFCRFTDPAEYSVPEQPCSIWDFSYLCNRPSQNSTTLSR